jgi:hypothetical protein
VQFFVWDRQQHDHADCDRQQRAEFDG